MALRVTKIICPSCEGTGHFRSLAGVRCMWCKGAKRLSVEDARRCAASLREIALGGYLGGDHDLSDCRAMEARAAKIDKLAAGVL